MKRLFFLLAFATGLALHVEAQNAKWTIMVYLDGDCDLEDAGIDDMNEMETIGSTDDVNIIVQMDRHPGYDDTNGDWSDTRRFRVTPDTDESIVSSAPVDQPGELNMGDPQTLTDFITWSAAQYPADNYALILWNHGGGWYKSASSSPKREVPNKDVCYDETDDDFLTNIEVSDAIRNSGIHLEILSYDACLMGMLEVAYQSVGLADIVLFSEETIPWDGYEYGPFLEAVTADPDMDALEFSQEVIDAYAIRYNDEDVEGAVTLSAIDMAKVPNICNALDTLVYYMLDAGNMWDTIGLARKNTTSFFEADYLDLQDFARELGSRNPNTQVLNAAQFLEATIDTAILVNFTSPFYSAAGGIAIYFPVADNYDEDYADAGRIFADATHWDEFLNTFHSEYFDDYGEPNNYFAQATWPNLNAFYSGKLTDASDVDIIRFFYEADGYTVDDEIQMIPPANFDLYLYTIIDTVISCIDSSVNEGVNTEVLSLHGLDMGYYYVEVRPVEVSSEAYTVENMSFYPEVFDEHEATPATSAYDDGEPDETLAPDVPVTGVGMQFFDYGMLQGIWYYITEFDTDLPVTFNLELFAPNQGMDLLDQAYPVTPEKKGWNYIDLSEAYTNTDQTPFVAGFSWEPGAAPALGMDTSFTSGATYLLNSDVWGESQEAGLLFIRPVMASMGNACYCNPLTTLTDSSGTILDGSGAANYGDDSYCTWIISPPNAETITLNITSLELEHGWDYLYIYDGDDNSMLLDSLTGSESGYTITSTGGAMYLEFISDESETDAGFELSYHATYPTVSLPAGTITEVDAAQWQVYPNPGNGILHIQHDGDPAAPAQLQVYGATGQLILNQVMGVEHADFTLDLSAYPKGVYHIHIIHQNASFRMQYILQ